MRRAPRLCTRSEDGMGVARVDVEGYSSLSLAYRFPE